MSFRPRHYIRIRLGSQHLDGRRQGRRPRPSSTPSAGPQRRVTTPTASGKTLCYNAPVLNAILQDPSTRALYLFPTKALAQDQLAELHALSRAERARAGHERSASSPTTATRRRTRGARSAARARRAQQPRHAALGHPAAPSALGEALREPPLRRHRRAARVSRRVRQPPGQRPAAAAAHLPALRLGSRLHLLVGDHRQPARAGRAADRAAVRAVERAARRAARSSSCSSTRRSSTAARHPAVVPAETRRVALEFLRRHLQVIVFAQSRLATEILTTYLKDAFEGPPGARERDRGYRGGYLPQPAARDRARAARRAGARVVSTNALELGIDIGALDVSRDGRLSGHDRRDVAARGRAGRRTGGRRRCWSRRSAPLDQFVVRHPSYFFDASPEHALINPDNLHILLDHVKCAAFELPFADRRASSAWRRGRAGGAAGAGRGGLRAPRPTGSGTGRTSRIRPTPSACGRCRPTTSSSWTHATASGDRRDRLHERAVDAAREGHLHRRGAAVPGGAARLRGAQGVRAQVDCDYYTDAITYTKVTILDDLRLRVDRAARRRAAPGGRGAPEGRRLASAAQGGRAAHGEVHVVSRVVGFKKIKFYTNENVGSGELDLPEQQMHTTAYWLTIPA
jgi:DEAD/DEAH box helicase domain-containing protein